MRSVAKRILGLILLGFAAVNALAIYSLFSVLLVDGESAIGEINSSGGGLSPTSTGGPMDLATLLMLGYPLGLILAFAVNVFLLGFFGVTGFRYLNTESSTDPSES